MTPRSRPLLIFDGHCSFCRRWIARWRHMTGDRVDYATYQEVASRYPEIPRERFARAVQLIEPDGRNSEAAEAVFRSLAYAPGRGWWLTLYRGVPLFAAISEWLYRLVARHRDLFDWVTSGIWGEHLVPPGTTLTCWIFLRVLGVIFAIAMVSLWVQIIGLAGREGIQPAAEFLQGIAGRYGAVRFWYLPTLCWLSASDTALQILCAAGTLLGVALALGFAPILCLIGLEAIYLSLATVGQDFLSFQWDGLLLETGFLAIFLAPWRLWSRPSSEPAPGGVGRALLIWLLFRLMFSSAIAKLTSGDPTWRHLTALTYHYETQPLPPWTAWFMHHLPAALNRFSAAAMFMIEGVFPFFLLAPRRIRFAAAAGVIALQGLIHVTGNYGFFNLLAIALCLLVLDDGAWPRGWRERVRRDPRPAWRWPGWVTGPTAILLIALSLVPLFSVLRWPITALGPIVPVYRMLGPFRIVNAYGLFSVMTTRRDEIIVEGSADGVTWRAYEFRYKPGDVTRRPSFVAPHQPRLDWQMWFASLSDYRRESWFLWFCQRLLEGKRPVLAMLAKNPFPAAPPRFIRATRYQYHFSDPDTRRRTGAWWVRTPGDPYCPLLALEGGQLVVVTGAP